MSTPERGAGLEPAREGNDEGWPAERPGSTVSSGGSQMPAFNARPCFAQAADSRW
jgi:hypothetical protein